MPAPLPDGSLAGLDLRGRDLAGASLAGRDLAGADLSDADLRGADLSDSNLTSATLRGTRLAGARLLHADLTDAEVDHADLTDASLAGATLLRTSLVDTTAVGASFSNAEWTDSKVVGGDWSRADLSGGSMTRVRLEGVTAREVQLREARLEDSDLRRVALDRAVADGLAAVDTSLDRVTLCGASVRGGDLRFTDLSAVDLREADLGGCSFESVDFRKPWLDGVQADGARFEACAGLGRDARRTLEDAGAALSETLPMRVAGAVFGAPGWAQVLALLVIVGGGGAWWITQRGPAPSAVVEGTPERAAVDAALAAGEEPGVVAVTAYVDQLLAGSAFEAAMELAKVLESGEASPEQRILSRLVVARTLVARGDAAMGPAVIEELAEYVRSTPAVEATFRLSAAEVAAAVHGAPAALEFLEEVPASIPPSDRAELELARASLLARAGNVPAALAAYDALMGRLDALPLLAARAREERAQLLKAGADRGAEERRLGELMESEDRELAGLSALGLARLAVREGEAALARERYEDAVERFGEVPEVAFQGRVELADVLATLGAIEEADRVLGEALKRADGEESSLVVRQARADLRRRAGDLDGAVRLAASTVRWATSPSAKLRARLQQAGLADEAGRIADAEALYAAVAEETDDPEMESAARFGLATLLRRTGRPAEALPLMQAALDVLPAQHRRRGAIVIETTEVLDELGALSVEGLQASLADARMAGLPDEEPAAYGGLLLRLADQMRAEGQAEDALRIYQQIADSLGASQEPLLGQRALDGQIAVLTELGRQEQVGELLDTVSVASLNSGDAEEACDASFSIALGRLEAGEAARCLEELRTMFGTCREPRLLLRLVPEAADALVARAAEDEAGELLRGLRDDEELPGVGRQVASLELGKLGSPDDLARAADGPDDSLADLARVEIARRLAEAGEAAEARALLEPIAEGDRSESVPRGLARLELGRIAAASAEAGAARAWFGLVVKESPEGWIRAQAEQELGELGQ